MTSRRRQKRRTVLAALAALTTTVLLMIALPASGAAASVNNDPPTVRELLDLCAKADFCTFHPTEQVKQYNEQIALAGQSANCTRTTQGMEVSWTKSALTANSLGVSLEVMVGPVSKIFMAGFKVFYNQEWTTTHTWSDKVRVEVPRDSIARVWYQAPMLRVVGQWEIHFGKKYHGHWHWYINNFTQVGPDTSSDTKGALFTSSTRMTASDRANYCRSDV